MVVAGNDTYQLNGSTASGRRSASTPRCGHRGRHDGFRCGTEIVITRNGTNKPRSSRNSTTSRRSVSAPQVTSPGGPGGDRGGGDTVQIIGDFAGHKPRPQHHHDRWHRGRRHGRHLGAGLGAPDRLQVERRQRHHRGHPAGARRDRAASGHDARLTTRVEDGITTLTSANHQISFVCPNPRSSGNAGRKTLRLRPGRPVSRWPMRTASRSPKATCCG